MAKVTKKHDENNENSMLKKALDATMKALNAALKEEIQWFDHQSGRVGLIEPAGSHGGIVLIEQEDGSISVEYLDVWAKNMRHSANVLGDDWRAELVHEIIRIRDEKVEEKFASQKRGLLLT